MWLGSRYMTAACLLAVLAQNASRGSSQLSVSSTRAFTPGQWVRLMLDSPASGGLVTDLMSGLIQEDPVYRGKPGMLSFISRVTVVGEGWVRLERSLPYNVSTRYNPTLHDFNLGASQDTAQLPSHDCM